METIARRRVPAACAIALAAILASACYVQRPLPHDPSYRPATWEPVMGIVTQDGTEVMFDEPAELQNSRVVGTVDGERYIAELPELQRLLVGHKTLDKPKTVLFGGTLITVFVVFFASIGLN